MKRLFVSSDLGELLIGGLLAVARADGIVKREEMESLRASAAELGLTMPAEEDLLLAEEVTPELLAAAIASGAHAYRGGGSPPDEISQSFLEAALRLCLADEELVLEEVLELRALADALAVPTERVEGWHVVRSFGTPPSARN
jgi:hypothetical protein